MPGSAGEFIEREIARLEDEIKKSVSGYEADRLKDAKQALCWALDPSAHMPPYCHISGLWCDRPDTGDISVTPEMIDAGTKVMEHWLCEEEFPTSCADWLARDVFLAMYVIWRDLQT